MADFKALRGQQLHDAIPPRSADGRARSAPSASFAASASIPTSNLFDRTCDLWCCWKLGVQRGAEARGQHGHGSEPRTRYHVLPSWEEGLRRSSAALALGRAGRRRVVRARLRQAPGAASVAAPARVSRPLLINPEELLGLAREELSRHDSVEKCRQARGIRTRGARLATFWSILATGQRCLVSEAPRLGDGCLWRQHPGKGRGAPRAGNAGYVFHCPVLLTDWELRDLPDCHLRTRGSLRGVSPAYGVAAGTSPR